MALITLDPNTSLQGKTLIVDDDNSAIGYSGVGQEIRVLSIQGFFQVVSQ